VQVIDIGNPAYPWLEGCVDTPGEAETLVIAAPFIYVADGAGGLQVLATDCGDPLAAEPASVAGPGLAAFPNPFNPHTSLRFSLVAPGLVRLSIHDPAGRLVAELAAGRLEAGRHELIWDGRDRSGRAVGSGVYLSRLETDAGNAARKLVLIR
jgi:hypothetical protein